MMCSSLGMAASSQSLVKLASVTRRARTQLEKAYPSIATKMKLREWRGSWSGDKVAEGNSRMQLAQQAPAAEWWQARWAAPASGRWGDFRRYKYLCIDPVVGSAIHWAHNQGFFWTFALLNTSEEMGQARDTSTHVTFNVLNSTSSPRVLHSPLILIDGTRGTKKKFLNSSVRI